MKKNTRLHELPPPLPHSDEAELSVLGAILLDEAALDEVTFLRADDFFNSFHQVIFSAIKKLRSESKPIELVTLHDELRAERQLEAAGGTVYVSKVIDGMPKVSNVQQYARMVYDASIRRALINATNTWAEVGLNENISAEKLKEQIEQGLMTLSMRYAMDMLDVTDYRAAAMKKLNASDEQSILRVNTGISKLDRATGGFRAGELVTVTAGTGVGKTLLAQQTRRFACSQNLHSLYCTAEMSAEQLSGREIATEAGVPHWKMRQPERLKPEEVRALVETASKECQKCGILDGELSLRKIWATAHMLKRTRGLHCVIIDYDELIDAPGKDELAQQRNLIRGAKALAMKLLVPVIMISQLRKALDAKEAQRPSLERIHGVGAKSKHSSFVIFVDRKYMRELKGDETEARICILKSRDGRVGEFAAKFNISTLRFEDALEEEPEKKVKRHHMDEANA